MHRYTQQELENIFKDKTLSKEIIPFIKNNKIRQDIWLEKYQSKWKLIQNQLSHGLLCPICGTILFKFYDRHLQKHGLSLQAWYDTLHDIKIHPSCPICGKHTKFLNDKLMYRKFCCNSHARMYIDIQTGLLNGWTIDEITAHNKVVKDSTTKCGYSTTSKYGSEFKIETNIKDVFRSVKSGVLKVKDNSRGYNKDKKMVITIPESNVFENVKISLGRGVSTIESINAKEVDFEIGAGKVVLNNLNISNKAEFECGAGKLEINNSRINNLKLDMGAGEVSVSGVLTGISEFDAGVGKLSIDLLDSIDNYSFTVDKGIGSIKLNNEDVSSDVTIGNGVNTIDIDGGIGEIIVTTK